MKYDSIDQDRIEKEKAADDSKDVIEEAVDRMRIAHDGWKKNRDRALEDIQFRDGQQWPDAVKREREEDDRPCLTFNRMESFVDQVTGDQRQNKPSIKVRPVDMMMPDMKQKVKNVAGDNDYEMAQVYEGIIRNIETVSRAHLAYDTAFDHAAGHGFGYLRVLTSYVDDDIFEQDIRIRRIKNSFSVMLDPGFEEPDASDTMYGFISKYIPKTEAERRYGDGVYTGLADQANQGEMYEHWWEEDKVRIAEYFRKVGVQKKIVLLNDGSVMRLDGENTKEWDKSAQSLSERIAQSGLMIVRSRVCETHKVEWRLVSGVKTLKGPIEFPSRWIPIIPVFGKELNVNGETIYRGVIRHAKDAQRNHNYWMTAATERVALSPKAPYVGPAKAFSGFEHLWETANSKNHGYLPYNDTASERPRRESPADFPAAELQMAASNVDEMKATMSLFDASLGAQSNETSGKAILARQREGDTANFAFADNLTRGIEHLGRVLVDMIPRVYDSQRVMRIRNQDESEDFVEINVTDAEGNRYHDITTGKYDVVAKVGPSFTTQRIEAAESLLEFMQAVAPSNPQVPLAIADLIASNMDWPGADELARRLRKLVPPELLEKDEDDGQPKPPPPPTPEQEVAMAEAEAKMADAEAKMAKAEATKAEAEAKMAEVMERLENLDEAIQEKVAEALAQFIAQSGQPPAPPQV